MEREDADRMEMRRERTQRDLDRLKAGVAKLARLMPTCPHTPSTADDDCPSCVAHALTRDADDCSICRGYHGRERIHECE